MKVVKASNLMPGRISLHDLLNEGASTVNADVIVQSDNQTSSSYYGEQDSNGRESIGAQDGHWRLIANRWVWLGQGWPTCPPPGHRNRAKGQKKNPARKKRAKFAVDVANDAAEAADKARQRAEAAAERDGAEGEAAAERARQAANDAEAAAAAAEAAAKEAAEAEDDGEYNDAETAVWDAFLAAEDARSALVRAAQAAEDAADAAYY